ncbi:MAG: PilT/PilU family type 4a pilus ATPase [Fibrobacteria bacterium]|nr:PilT/PilU family type 4a pilus ATPase [Fibrobacteria bacterium]
MENVEELLRGLVKEGVSDIHFKVRRPPLQRFQGELIPTDLPELSAEDTEDMAKKVLGPEAWARFVENQEADSSYSLPGMCRFRVNVFKQRGTVSIIMRIIPFNVPSLEELRVPEVAKKIATLHRGLVLVTGVVGSGKSSTLAAMIRFINENKQCHIVTLEDPIEFLHRDQKSSINQREVSVDTQSFSRALKGVLRQDPNVILVGEMRDVDTMATALTAAESGHLVLSTLHTADCKETINRLVDAFPTNQEKQIRLQLSQNLAAVISQRLLPRADGKGRVMAPEIMVVNAAISEYIMDPLQGGSMLDNMAKGREQYGSVTFDQTLLDLYEQELITKEVALQNATSPNDLRLKMAIG